MHQSCLLNCASYIINTYTDMTWIWYDKGIRGKELEKEQSECIFHELQRFPAKVLNMMFQRRKGAWRAWETNIWLYENKPGIFICNCTHADIRASLITHLICLASPSWLSDQGSVKKKRQVWYNINSSFYFHWCLNLWWAVALLQLLTLNKSEIWVSLRVAFSISITFLHRLVKL